MTGSNVIRWLVLLLLACAALIAAAQQTATTRESSDAASQAQQLFQKEQWSDLVTLLQSTHRPSADLQYYYGTALARLGRWEDARRAFVIGYRMSPSDERFPVELSGVAFKQKDYRKAICWLHRALRLNPNDSYAKDFLGSIYFLQGNLDATLKYWNQVGKPQIEAVDLQPTPQVNPALLDRAFAFSPTSVLQRADLRTSESRVRGLEIFPSFNFDLVAHGSGKFDVIFRSQERNGWGETKWQAAARLLRGVYYQTIYPEYFNIGNDALNSESLLRWDAQKRRVLAAVSGPLKLNPKWRFRVAIDLRDENWDIRDSSVTLVPSVAGLTLRRGALTATITSFHSGRLRWLTGAEFSHRDFRNVASSALLPAQLLARGYELKHLAQLDYELANVPERRFVVSSGVSSQIARIWSEPRETFARLQASVQAHWLPRSSGDDYETREQLRAGTVFGSFPFDELFMLGVERDNDLWLRGHAGTHGGRKGNAPLGRSYLLSNWELDKNLYSNGLLSFKIGPFVDVGNISYPSPVLGSKQWLVDSGVNTKVRALGICVVLSYGRDLVTGRNVIYATAAR